MGLDGQRRARTTCRWVGLTVLAWWGSGCTPVPAPNDAYVWPVPSSLAIWAVLPETALVLGLDEYPLIIRWNDVELSGTQPTVSLRLIHVDPNFASPDLVSGIDAVADGTADEWAFSGLDANSTLVGVGYYTVEYTIDDGAGGVDTDTSVGAVVVPMRFTTPTVDTQITQSAGLLIEWEQELRNFGANVRLYIGFVADPNDNDDVAWIDPNGAVFPDLLVPAPGLMDSLNFNGTVFDDGDPNGHLIEPNTYVLVGRLTTLGLDGTEPFFRAPGRVEVLPDPNP